MKATKGVFELLEKCARENLDPVITAHGCKLMLEDLRTLHRLESEPRAGWEVITEKQRNSRFQIVAHSEDNPFLAQWANGMWFDHFNNIRDPKYYLANIPAVPKPVEKPTADEWASAVGQYVGKWGDPTFGKLAMLMERHNAASK